MLRITAISAGAIDYLLRGSGCADHGHSQEAVETCEAGREVGRAGVEYLVGSAGVESAGVWFGAGLGMIGIGSGTGASERDVRAVFGQLRHPDSTQNDPVFLGRAPRRFRSTEQRIEAALAAEPDADAERRAEIENTVRADGRKAVGYYDLTFSPVKSVSVYWAALVSEGRHGEAAQVVAAHREAVAEAMAWAEREVAYTRVGYHGKTSQGRSVGRYEQASGLVWTRWDHFTNRAQEPQLHSHAAVLNRVVTMVDGRIRALDGAGFKAIKHGVDAIYAAAYERKLTAWHAVVFAQRPDGKAREIAGIDQGLVREASTRHADVVARVCELVEVYTARHGRAPSPAVRAMLSRAAALETRAAKSELAVGVQLRRWCEPHRGQLRTGLEQVRRFAGQVAECGHPDQRNHPDRGVDEVLRGAIERTQARYATFTIGNLIEAITWELATAPGLTEIPAQELVGEVLNNPVRFGMVELSPPDPAVVPEALRRVDGKSRYRPHHHERYTTLDQLAVETQIVAMARVLGAPAVVGAEVELARVEMRAAGLSGEQADAVARVLSSGRAGDVLIGPAGAGKSHTVGVLARVWGERIGGRVIGLATSQIATMELADNGLEAMNTTRFAQQFTPDQSGHTAQHIEPGDLVVVDEVGMSGTAELARIARIVAEGGGKLLYTGDHQQLGAVEAGGMLNLLVADNGCVELGEIHRFTHSWEREASIRLRAGNVEVLHDYEVHGRLIGGSEEEVTEAAMRGWLADTLVGKQSLLVTASNDQATHLSAQVRAELVRLGHVQAQVLATGRDGNPIGFGDWVQARRNDPTIPLEGPGMVTNRATYRVLGQDRWSRALRVRSTAGVIAHLPPDYVAAHTTLAYASTVHAAQGRTVDTCHALIDLSTDRASAYVALTRGREVNTAYVICQREPDAHHPEPLATTARARMHDILTRPEPSDAVTAEMTRRTGIGEGRELGWIGAQFDDITAEAARDQHTGILTGLLAPELMIALAAEPGYRRLLRSTRAAELAGHNLTLLMAEVIDERSLYGAESISDVLRWRIHRATQTRVPERTVTPGDWSTLTPPLHGQIGTYADALARAATARQTELGHDVLSQRPEWALHRLGEPPADRVALGEWVERAGVIAGYRELRAIPTDVHSIGAAPAREQVLHRVLWHHAHTALGHTTGVELDYSTASDAGLREMCQHYQRECTWAPYHVHHELREARLVATGYDHDAILWRAEAHQLTPGTPERAAADADVAAAEHLAACYHARAEHLQVIATAREQWHHDTEQLRTRHQLASEELARRGLTPQPPPDTSEQTALFDIPESADHNPTTTDPAGAQPAGRAQRRPSQTAQATEAVETALATTHTAGHDPTQAAVATESHQATLFAAVPHPTDIAAAEPLREPDTPPDPNPGTDTPVTLAQARLQTEIITELHAPGAPWVATPNPMLTHAATRAALAAECLRAHHRRTHAELHHQQLDQTLDRHYSEDLDTGLAL